MFLTSVLKDGEGQAGLPGFFYFSYISIYVCIGRLGSFESLKWFVYVNPMILDT